MLASESGNVLENGWLGKYSVSTQKLQKINFKEDSALEKADFQENTCPKDRLDGSSPCLCGPTFRVKMELNIG